MPETTSKQGGSDLFLAYLDKCKEEVRSKSANEYYHVNVVAEAYEQGFTDGTKSAEQEFVKQLIHKRLDEFKKKAQQVYILSSKLVSFIREKGFKPEALYICPTYVAPRSIIVIDEESILNDEFNMQVYPKISEFRKVFLTVFADVLDMSIVSSQDLDIKLLKKDGFGYEETYTS